MEDKLENQYFASLYANEKAFIVQTESGFRLLMLDTLFPPHILPPNVDDNLLGQAISQALKIVELLNMEVKNVKIFSIRYKEFNAITNGLIIYEKHWGIKPKQLFLEG